MGRIVGIFFIPFLILVTTTRLGASSPPSNEEAMPGVNTSLEEEWEWMTKVAKDSKEGQVNINMYMSGNKMSMSDTVFTMDVDKEEDAGDRMTKPKDENDDDKVLSRSWSPSSTGGSITMHMYNNSMSMLNTVFTMAAGTEGAMAGSGTHGKQINGEDLNRRGKEGQNSGNTPLLNINMYMYDNIMTKNTTVFTF